GGSRLWGHRSPDPRALPDRCQRRRRRGRGARFYRANQRPEGISGSGGAARERSRTVASGRSQLQGV
ncbi:MAG: hypothetical protein AVDCRST_MAG59-5405, partial [uncultured Thermomicrobiales bacterium]